MPDTVLLKTGSNLPLRRKALWHYLESHSPTCKYLRHRLYLPTCLQMISYRTWHILWRLRRRDCFRQTHPTEQPPLPPLRELLYMKKTCELIKHQNPQQALGMKAEGTRQTTWFSSKPIFFYDLIKEFIVEIIGDILHVRMEPPSRKRRPAGPAMWSHNPSRKCIDRISISSDSVMAGMVLGFEDKRRQVQIREVLSHSPNSRS